MLQYANRKYGLFNVFSAIVFKKMLAMQILAMVYSACYSRVVFTNDDLAYKSNCSGWGFERGMKCKLLTGVRGCRYNQRVFNTLRSRQMDAISETILFINEKFRISNRMSLKFVHKGPIDNIPALVQIMLWRRPGDKPLSEPLLTQFTDAYKRH